MDVRDGGELSLVVEASEWLEWMQDQMANGLLNVLDEETSVLFAVRAIIRVNGVAPVYGSFPMSKKAPLVKSYIVFQCWEQQNTLRKDTECGLREC